MTYDVDGSLVGRYRKMHIPDDPLYYEKFYFTPVTWGSQSPRRDLVSWVSVFVGISGTQKRPVVRLARSEILLYPTAIGWHPAEKEEYGAAQHAAWETAMRAHAIANGVFVGAANRVGLEGGLQFWGASFVADPGGNILHRASHESEELVIVPCDLSLIDSVRTHWPFLRDRRIDAYSDITQRYIDVP